jgi:outer membrane immunogenic protein
MTCAFPKKLAGLGAIAVVLAVPAQAQEPPAIWTGFYAGAHTGYGWAIDEPAPFDVSGGVLGMHAGYNYQMGVTVLGIEGDYTGSWMEDTQSAGWTRVTLDVDYLASIRGRLGYALGNALLYGTIGYAWADAGTSGLGVSRTTDFEGLVLGAGMDYKFAPDWSARVEGLNYWLSPDRKGQDIDDLDATVIRAGITWHLPSSY